MVITQQKKKKQKKRDRMEKPAEPVEGESGEKRVRFDLTQNKITEFFKHGKVAQRVLYQNQ